MPFATKPRVTGDSVRLSPTLTNRVLKLRSAQGVLASQQYIGGCEDSYKIARTYLFEMKTKWGGAAGTLWIDDEALP